MKPPQTAGPTLWPDRLIVKHRANTAGRDFVCGDIHGCFDTVEHALEQLDYDPLRDRLFSVGDLIDRGPRSADALGWITQGRIATVRGNHEQMMVAALTLEGGESFKSGASRRWQDNGGAWWWGFAGLDETGWPIWRETENQARLGEWLDALRQVPYLRTTETAAGTVGIVHTTDLHHADWEAMCQCVQELAARIERRGGILGAGGTDTPTSILWGRPNVEREQRHADDLPAAITGIELIITGHTPGVEARWTRRNVLCIDTGVHIEACGHLTVAEIQSGEPRLHRFARIDAIAPIPDE